MSVIALIPAHNEEEGIADTLNTLLNQSHPIDKIVVILDNCTDKTEEIARNAGVEVYHTEGNSYKKAGALNQALHLAENYDYIFDGDADTIFDSRFVERALEEIEKDTTTGAVSCREGIKTYPNLSAGKKFIYTIVRNQRYRWDTDRIETKSGNTQIVVGPAGLFRTAAVQEVGGWQNSSLTEDAAISYDLRLAGWRTVLGKTCYAYSDSPLNLRELWKQRVRWSRGYQDIKARPWGKPMLTAKFTLLLERMLLLWLIVWSFAFVTGNIKWEGIWLVPIMIAMIDRLTRLRFFPKIHITDIILAVVVPFDILIFIVWQATMVTAWFQGITNRERAW